MARGLFGFSIDASGTSKAETGKRLATKITHINSVDLIIEPGAGGELINLIEARDKRLEDDMHMPEPYKSRLTKRQFVPGLDRRDKLIQMLDDFFNPAKPATSFKECYIELTGDRKVTGRIENCDPARFREAFGSGDLGSVLGNSINRRMVHDYGENDRYSVWRMLVTIASAPDFRTQHVTRFGGYGDLPTVSQGAPYPALISPNDEEATYALAKRGGTEEITLEHIKNDDVRFIRSVPKKLAQAAKRTLSKFVLDFLRTNPVIYDGQPLFSAAHSNLGSAALSAAAVSAARTTMRRQPEAGSGDPLNIEPKYIWVPYDSEETAVNLFQRTTNNDKTALQSLALQVMAVWYWSDMNDWCLSADPLQVPTIEICFLDGNQEPDLFVQDAATVGSMFSNDKLTWKIQHIYSGTPIEYRGVHKSVVT